MKHGTNRLVSGRPLAHLTTSSTYSNNNNYYCQVPHSPSSSISCSSALGQKARFTSTAFLLAKDMKHKLGLGGNNWSRMTSSQYESVIAKGLETGVILMEAGQEGGDQALVDAWKKGLDSLKNKDSVVAKPLTMTLRIGYRTVMPTEENNKEDGTPLPPSTASIFPGDVAVETHPMDRKMPPLDYDKKISLDGSATSSTSSSGTDPMIQILHNTSAEYIHNQLQASPLVQEYQKHPSDISVVALVHNPEAQIMSLANEHDINEVSLENRQIFLRERLVEAFCAMEQAVADKVITSYGVASNGLILPAEHPLALSTDTILDAVQLAMEKMGSTTTKTTTAATPCHLSVIQLPINLMERTGLDVAKKLYNKIQTDEQCQHLRDEPPLEIYAMRPLTCYPDRGTGTGHAFQLVDYLLPSGPRNQDEKNVKGDDGAEEVLKDGEAQDVKEYTISEEDLVSKQWSNQMEGPPVIYSIALKKAMSHFDAEKLLEEKMKRELTSEERETLDGCKLLQSMLHDLDAGLAKVRSLGAHEEDLYQRIIPLIHDTFEGYDEETADVLEMFFKCYALAVRYSIARNTRELLKQGGDDGKGYKYDSIPDDEKLQDYALKYLLKERAISKVVVGTTKPDHVTDLLKECARVTKEDEAETKK